MNFKVGDTVRLRSGGPVLTVVEIGKNGWLACTWFDSDKKANHHSYPPESLEMFKPAKAGLVGTW